MVLEATKSFQCHKVKDFKATQLLHHCNNDCLERKKGKIADFLQRIKRQNHFIDSFLEEQRIVVALTDFFSESRPPLFSMNDKNKQLPVTL